MVRIVSKAFRRFLPALTDIFIRRKPSEGFESLGEIIGHQEGVEMLFQVLMRLVIVAFDRGFFECTVHALSLPMGPGMMRFGEAMLNTMLLAYTPEDIREGLLILLAISELHAVVRQDGVDLVWDGSDEVAEELRRDGLDGLRVSLGVGKLAGAVDGDKPGELACFGTYFSHINVEGADRIGLASRHPVTAA
jgi:hypothetical protein